jgi:CubicO group peptidase (beta-lactamase class C family)
MHQSSDEPSRRTDRMSQRRRFLSGVGATGAFLLAGCLGDSDSEDDANEATPTNADPTATPTPSETRTSTPAPTDTATPTQTETATQPDLPITGEEVPELAVFDETMRSFMDDIGARAGALGVARDGEVVLQHGYGWADPEETTQLAPDALFRIASISKKITIAAVLKLVNSGELSRDDKIRPLLEVEPTDGEPADERFQEVTVSHLVNHSGGWDIQQLGYDPMYSPVRIADALELDGPPTKYDIARYMLDQPMQFDPGQRESYSNFGYSLLGQVIEGVTGMEYQSYLEAEILGPEGIEGIEIGYTRPADRPPEEVWYNDDETCVNAFTLDDSEEYTCADAGFLVSEFDSAGGHIASTGAMLEYLDAYWLFGEPRDDRNLEYGSFGSHPGNLALAGHYPNGVDVVAMFNSRRLPVDSNFELDGMVEDAIEAVDSWP